MIKLLFGILVFVNFAFAKPLSEVIKDIEVSGEINYKYEHFNKKSKNSKTKPNSAKSAK